MCNMSSLHAKSVYPIRFVLSLIPLFVLAVFESHSVCGQTTPPIGCQYDGKFYKPGEQITRGQVGEWCYGTSCSPTGEIVRWDNFNCPQTTLPPTLTTQRGCVVNGKFYAPGEDISRGQQGNWCYGTYCDLNGQLINWDDFNCMSTTTSAPPITTTPRSTPTPSVPIPPTTQSVCLYNGVTYQPGQQIQLDDRGCGFECGQNGELLFYPCTTPPLTTRPPGCYYNGNFYPPDSVITQDANGCGAYCSSDGQMLLATCTARPSTRTTPTPSATPSPRPWITTTARQGCYYNGRFYPPGRPITQDTNGCGAYCTSDGQVLVATCTARPSTTPTPSATPSPRPWITTTARQGCYYNGRFYPLDRPITQDTNGCGAYCTSDGQVLLATCTARPSTRTTLTTAGTSSTPVPTTVAQPPTTVSVCLYNGVTYQPGQPVQLDDRGCGFECGQNGELLPYPCLPPTTTPPPRGCYYNGKFYEPNKVFTQNPSGCGGFCTSDGQLVLATCTSRASTPPSSTTPPSGCFLGGKKYNPGEDIDTDSFGCRRVCNQHGRIEHYPCFITTTSTIVTTVSTPTLCLNKYTVGERFGEGQQGSWCYGSICEADGSVLTWDNFQCNITTMPSTTIPTRAQETGCYVDSQWYRPGEEITRVYSLNMCYGTLCDDKGDVIAWEDFTCGNSTEGASGTQEPVKDCQYKGRFYKPGQKIKLADNRGCKVYCSLQGRVRIERFPCLTPVTRSTTAANKTPIPCVRPEGADPDVPLIQLCANKSAKTLPQLMMTTGSLIFCLVLQWVESNADLF